MGQAIALEDLRDATAREEPPSPASTAGAASSR